MPSVPEHGDFSLTHSVPCQQRSEGTMFWKDQAPAVRKMSEVRLVAVSENILTC